MPRLRPYPWLQADPDVNWREVNPTLLRRLNQLGKAKQTVITITSGHRSNKEQQYLWDNRARLGLVEGKTVARPGSSRHESGEAIDANVNGEAVGEFFDAKTLRRYGLSALEGDLVHVELVGGKQPASEPAPETAPAVKPSAVPEFEFRPDFEPPTTAPMPGVTLAPPGSARVAPQLGEIAETWRLVSSTPFAAEDTRFYARRLLGDE